MLRYFLRKQGIRDLSLPAAVLPVLAANVPRYQVLSRSRVSGEGQPRRTASGARL